MRMFIQLTKRSNKPQGEKTLDAFALIGFKKVNFKLFIYTTYCVGIWNLKVIDNKLTNNCTNLHVSVCERILKSLEICSIFH